MIPIRRAEALTILAGALALSACGSDEPPESPAEAGTPVPAGTYTYEKGPFPVTLTTEETTYDMSNGGDPYRVIAMDPNGFLTLDFPVNAADLTQPPSEETDEFGMYEVAGPIEFPDDIDAWLQDASALDIEDEGTLDLADGEAAWWDLQVTDSDATCFEEAQEDPCVTLWPFLESQQERQIGVNVFDRARLYAVETSEGPLMLIAETRGDSEEDLPAFLDTTDQIVGSITLP